MANVCKGNYNVNSSNVNIGSLVPGPQTIRLPNSFPQSDNVVMSLGEAGRAALRERVWASLPFALDGSIPLVARAWAVRGRRP